MELASQLEELGFRSQKKISKLAQDTMLDGYLHWPAAGKSAAWGQMATGFVENSGELVKQLVGTGN